MFRASAFNLDVDSKVIIGNKRAGKTEEVFVEVEKMIDKIASETPSTKKKGIAVVVPRGGAYYTLGRFKQFFPDNTVIQGAGVLNNRPDISILSVDDLDKGQFRGQIPFRFVVVEDFVLVSKEFSTSKLPSALFRIGDISLMTINSSSGNLNVEGEIFDGDRIKSMQLKLKNKNKSDETCVSCNRVTDESYLGFKCCGDLRCLNIVDLAYRIAYHEENVGCRRDKRECYKTNSEALTRGELNGES